MYNIDFNILAQMLTPWFVRKPRFLSWVYSMFKPLAWLNTNVIQPWRERMVKYLSYDGMTVNMERYLNIEYSLVYNPNTRAADITAADIIYIETTSNNALRYVYNKAEQNPPIYLYNKAESEEPEYFYNLSEAPTFPNFTVWIPNSLGGTFEVNGTQDNILLKRRINLFRLAGFTNYLIKRY